jgi:DNA-binding IscR family transcriptional regulator
MARRRLHAGAGAEQGQNRPGDPHIDGPLAAIACASRTAYQPCRDCKSVKNCTVRLMMTKVRDAMSDVLDQVTVADMVAMGEAALPARAAAPLGRRLR